MSPARISLMFIIGILIFAGCSSGHQNPIDPIVPDQQQSREISSMSGTPQTSDSYWNENLIVKDKLWLANRNPNGSIHYALGPGVEISSDPLKAVEELPNIFLLPSTDFRVESDKTHAGLRVVILRQYYNGLRVWPSLGQLVWGREGKLVKAMADVFPIGNLDIAPGISSTQATEIVFSEIGKTDLKNVELVVFGTMGDSYLAYRVRAGSWIHFVNAIDGSIINRRHLQWNSYEGHVSGYASQPDPFQPELVYDFSNIEMRMRINPDEIYPTSYMPLTNTDGMYHFNAPQSQLQAELRLYGPLLNINNNNNYPYDEISIKRDIFDGQPDEWFLDDTNSLRDERTVWYWVNHARDYMKDVDPTGNEMDWRLIGYVQNAPWCNAYADDFSINFFKAAGNCINLGYIPDVIVHEWGHVHQFKQQAADIPPDSLLEGNADVTANTICDSPYVGWGAQGQGTYFRISENDLKWPLDECGGESHCLGRIVAGAFWDLRGFIGRDYHDYLWHFSKDLLGQTFQDWGADVVIVDDDDDDPLNGSPHFNFIYESFEINHNIDIPDATNLPTSGVVLDIVPFNPQVRIPSGQPNKVLGYNLKVMNLDNQATTVNIWAAVELPWSAWYGPILPPKYTKHGPVNIPINALQTYDFNLQQNLPSFAPVGQYKYHVRIGQYVDNINDVLNDDKWFTFWIF